MSEEQESLTLKWGTLKGYRCQEGTEFHRLLGEYHKLGVCLSAAAQRDTPEQQELLCKMVDAVPGDIYLDWDGKYVSKEAAKKYIREYHNGGDDA